MDGTQAIRNRGQLLLDEDEIQARWPEYIEHLKV